MVRTIVVILSAAAALFAANPAAPGDWKTWVIRSGNDHSVAPPPNVPVTRGELHWMRGAMAGADPKIAEQIRFWDAGPPSYRWMDLVAKRQIAGQPMSPWFVRVYTYVSLAVYDATVAAFKAKQTYARRRPSELDPTIRPLVAVPDNPSYPSDYAATATAAAAVLSYLIPAEAASFQTMAEQAGRSRVYAGVEYPSDYAAGVQLGQRVAEQVIAKARTDGSDIPWTGTVPVGPCRWTGTNPGFASAANWRTLLLSSPAEFRPPAPPACDSADVQAQLAAVRNFPRALTSANFSTNAKAFYWQATEGVYPWALVHLNRWVLEDKMDAPAAARAYALLGAVGYDAFIASQDGKFAYWYIRPAQLDSSLTPLFPSPNFPSYPSNHSTFSTARAEVLAHLFPDRADFVRALAKEAGQSRIWAGIHFPMDLTAGETLGEKVAGKFIDWAKSDGSGGN